MRILFLFLALVAATLAGVPVPARAQAKLDLIRLPDGFRIDVYASGLTNPRQMVLAPGGTVFVGSFRLGGNEPKDVYALVDRNKDQKADEVIVVAKALRSPNGVAFHNGALYVGERTRILRFDAIEKNLASPPAPAVVVDNLPGDGNHGWKFIAFGPDGKLYVPVGGPCNVCDNRKTDPRLASILRMNPDGSSPEVFAHGVRNSVGFDWHPVTRELWFTNNGRDMMGDNVPPDTLNRAPKAGLDFGFPFCHAGDIADPEFGKSRGCAGVTPPAQKLGPHVASLGMAFYTGSMFPAEYRNQIFIAEHGSWNRSEKIGYRLTVVKTDGKTRATSYDAFATGWLQEQQNWGRPVDVLVMPDGALLVSDEQAGVIYRISYAK